MRYTRPSKEIRYYLLSLLMMVSLSLSILFPGYLMRIYPTYVCRRVHMNKKLVHEFKSGNDQVRVFIESREEEFKLDPVEKVEKTVKKAYEDFRPLLVIRYWNEYIGEPEGRTFDLLFLNEETFGFFVVHIFGKRYKFNGLFSKSHATAYFRGDGDVYNVNTRHSTIRHETFHYLSTKYNINFRERAAYAF